MQSLKVYQSLWAMDGLPGVDLDNGLPAVLKQILDAGFQGAGVNLARKARADLAAKVLADAGMDWEAQGFVRNADDLRRFLDQALALGGAHHLNIQVANVATSLGEAIKLMKSLLAACASSPLPVFFETHRGRLTNDLFLTVSLLEACPDLRLTADICHYVTTHEMALPLEPHLESRIQAVLSRSSAFHFRVAGPNQVQVSLDAPQHAAWRTQHETWWREGMRQWRSSASEDDSLTVLCELGPPPYAITDTTGAELTDRWAEALQLKRLAEKLFNEAESQVLSAAR